MSGDYRRGIVAASPAPDPATGLVTVTVDGTDVVAAALGELPEAGWDVWVEQRGPKAQDWVVTDIQVPSSIRRTFSRYVWARSASGIAAGAFTDVGTPPTTPWSTGSVASNHSILTATADCFISVVCNWSGQFGTVLTVVTTGVGVVAQVISGGVYQGAVNYAGLLLDGETVDLITRNVSGTAQNLVSRSLVTFCDARWVVAQT